MKIWLQTVTLIKKSYSNISPLGHDRDKLKLISIMMRTRRMMKKRRSRKTSRTRSRTMRRSMSKIMTNLHFGGLEES